MTYRNQLVRDVMATRFTVFFPDTSIDEATSTILSQGLMGAPVVEDGKLVGILSEKDVFKVVANQVFQEDNDHSGGLVRDFMTTGELITVPPDQDIASIASKFLSHIYRGLPVVDRRGQVVGLISRREILRAMVKMRDEPRLQHYPDYRRPQT